MRAPDGDPLELDLEMRILNELYRHVQNLSLSFHGKSRSGDLVERVTHEALMRLGGRYATSFRSQIVEADCNTRTHHVVAR